MKNQHLKSRGAFFLEGNNLYVANDGKAFDRHGVIALCMPNLSSKGDKVYDDHPLISDGNWISALSKSQLQQFLTSRNRLQTDTKEEESTTQQYAGRWLLELLQNIDDAMGPDDDSKYIGAKGLGFLSIMEIGSKPEIFSGRFHFLFSKERTKEALEHHGLPRDSIENTPDFQVPWPAKPDKKVNQLLSAGFTTVIKLLVKENSLQDVRDQLTTMDHHFLLFAQNIDEIIISLEGKRIVYSKNSELINENGQCITHNITITSNTPEKTARRESWQRWQRSWESSEDNKKRSSCMFCLPIKNGKCVPHLNYTNVYNFYPTEQSSDIKGYLHLSFNLSRDRKNLLMWGDRQDLAWDGKYCNEENKRLIAETHDLIIDDVVGDPNVPFSTVIGVFASLNTYAGNLVTKGDPLKRLQGVLIKAIKNHPFLPRFGGGLTSPASIKIWENNFIDCLKPNQDAQIWDLAPKTLQPYFADLREFDVNELDSSEALHCLSSTDLKNQNGEDRNKIAGVIAYYTKTNVAVARHVSPRFLEIKFLTDNNNNLVSLNDDIFLDEILEYPTFMETPRLSKGSSRDLKEELLTEEISTSYSEAISERFITNRAHLFTVKFMQFLEAADESFWQKFGFQALRFAYDFFKEDPKIFEETTKGYSENPFYVPKKKAGEWGKSNKGFFSLSWTETKALNHWFEKHGYNEEFEIFGKDAFINKLFSRQKKANKKQRTQKKNSAARNGKNIELFLEAIGIRNIPAFRMFEDRAIVSAMEPEYYKNYASPSSFRYFYNDYKIDGLTEFLTGLSTDKALALANQLIVNAKESPASYRAYGDRTHLRYHNREFANLALYQIYNTKWIQLTSSPLNPTGLFSPKECFLAKSSHPIFPTLHPDRVEKVLGERTDTFTEQLQLKTEFAPTDETWLSWMNSLAQGYDRLATEKDSDITKLNAQIEGFLTTFLTKSHLCVTNEASLVPAHSSDRDSDRLNFNARSTVMINNTTVSDHLIKPMLKSFGYTLFVLRRNDFRDIDFFSRLGLQNITDNFRLKPEKRVLPSDVQEDYIEWLTERWDIFQALDSKFPEKKNNTRLLEEVSTKIIVCFDLKITLESFGVENKNIYEPTELKFFEDRSEVKERIFIAYDENKRNFIEYLCNHFFGWSGRTETVSVLMEDPINISRIRAKLEDNNLPRNLVDYFVALNKKQDEENRKLELNRRAEIGAAVLKAFEDSFGEEPNENGVSLKNTEEKKSDNLEALPSREKSAAGKKADGNLPDRVQPKETNDKPEKNSKSNFRTRLSGHLRPRNGAEIIGRKYFDDEDKSHPLNHRIGTKAEKIILSHLEREVQPEEINLLGGNNKGFDIEYRLHGEMHFVEVKGLVGSWDDNDVLLSKSQFEKSQKERDRFSIFIVEFVEDEPSRKVWEIRDPTEYFQKMQLDHGWKSFALPHNEIAPQEGRYLVINDEKKKITRVSSTGLITKIFVEDELKPITYRPNKMTIEEHSNR